jgi:hypothetical protein
MIAAMARDDSVEPNIASNVYKRFWDKFDNEESATSDRWKPAAAKNEVDVTVECKAANYNTTIST